VAAAIGGVGVAVGRQQADHRLHLIPHRPVDVDQLRVHIPQRVAPGEVPPAQVKEDRPAAHERLEVARRALRREERRILGQELALAAGPLEEGGGSDAIGRALWHGITPLGCAGDA